MDRHEVFLHGIFARGDGAGYADIERLLDVDEDLYEYALSRMQGLTLRDFSFESIVRLYVEGAFGRADAGGHYDNHVDFCFNYLDTHIYVGDSWRLTDEQRSTIDSLLHGNWVEWNDLEKEGSDGLTVNDVKDVLRGFKSCERLSEDVLLEIATRVFEEERYTVTDGGSLVLDRVDVYAGYSEYARKRIDDECGAIPDDICDFIDTLSAGKKLLRDGTVDWFETETGEIVVWD